MYFWEICFVNGTLRMMSSRKGSEASEGDNSRSCVDGGGGGGSGGGGGGEVLLDRGIKESRMKK